MVEVLGGLVKRVVLLEGLNGRDKVYTIKPIYNNLHVVKVDRWQGKEKGRKKNYNTCKKPPVKISRPKNEKGMDQCGQWQSHLKGISSYWP